MATFSRTGFKTLNYNSFRPRYPASFYKLLTNYKNDGTKFEKALDIGCGTGIATYDLLNCSEKVIGIDLSPSMVETSNSVIHERCNELDIKDPSRIKFQIGDLDNLKLEESNFDLIVAAQCLHWSKDFDQLFKEVHRLLRPGGVFAYWYYVDPIIIDNKTDKQVLKKVKDVYLKYMYDDPNLIGPYWEQPGRDIIKNYYKDIDEKIPKIFKDIKIDNYQVDIDNYVAPSEDKNLVLRKDDTTINELINYIGTYSGLHNFQEANKDTTIIKDFKNLLQQTTGWDDDTKFNLVWNTGYTFLRK